MYTKSSQNKHMINANTCYRTLKELKIKDFFVKGLKQQLLNRAIGKLVIGTNLLTTTPPTLIHLPVNSTLLCYINQLPVIHIKTDKVLYDVYSELTKQYTGKAIPFTLFIITDHKQEKSLWGTCYNGRNGLISKHHYLVKGVAIDYFIAYQLTSLLYIVLTEKGIDKDKGESMTKYEKKNEALQNIVDTLTKLFTIDKLPIDFDKNYRAAYKLVCHQVINSLPKALITNTNQYLHLIKQQAKGFVRDLFLEVCYYFLLTRHQPKTERFNRSSDAKVIASELKSFTKSLDSEYFNDKSFLVHINDNQKESLLNSLYEHIYHFFAAFDYALIIGKLPAKDSLLVTPHTLSWMYENGIAQKTNGAYYTPSRISYYLSTQSIDQVLVNELLIDTSLKDVSLIKELKEASVRSVFSIIVREHQDVLKHLLVVVIPNTRLNEPCIGTGGIVLVALRHLLSIYMAAYNLLTKESKKEVHQRSLWLNALKNKELTSDSLPCYIVRCMIQDVFYGVDIMGGSVEMSKLMLYLFVQEQVGNISLLPFNSIMFNIRQGNGLIGNVIIDDNKFNELQLKNALVPTSYRQLVDRKNKITLYAKSISV